jgi:hypothetical protein
MTARQIVITTGGHDVFKTGRPRQESQQAVLPATATFATCARFADCDHITALTHLVGHEVDADFTHLRQVFVKLTVDISGYVIGFKLLETFD